MSLQETYFGNTIARDLFGLIAGKRIGAGVGREVWSCEIDDSLVIKFETEGRSFQNVIEWETWCALEHSDHAKWLAPCRAISCCGSVLLQARTMPMRTKELPERVPSWATDIKPENWGLLNGKPVMHDYGYSRLLSGATKAMRKAHW